jgi:hypothetical protein
VLRHAAFALHSAVRQKVAPSGAGSHRKRRRSMCVQECDEVRLNDNAGTSARHRTWCALVDLDGISDTSKGNPRAEASDGAPHNDDAVRALVPRLTQRRSP